MRIGIINEVLDTVSGTSLQTCALAKMLSDYGHEVHVFGLGYLNRSLNIGKAIFHSAGTPAKQLMDSEEIILGFTEYVLEANKNIHFDLLHAHYCTATFVATVNRIVLGTPFVITLHGYESCACLTSELHLCSLKIGFELASKIIGISKSVVDEISQIVKLENSKVSIIPDVIIENVTETLCFPQNEADKNTLFPFVFVGRMVKEKGLWELIYAFEFHYKSYPDSRLFLVGNWLLYDSIKKVYNRTSINQRSDIGWIYSS